MPIEGKQPSDRGFLSSKHGGQKWHNILPVPKEKSCQLRILYPAKISFRNKGEIKTFSAEGRPRELAASTPLLKNGWRK